MACGRTALVSDILGHREWVQPEVNGWLFLDGDEKALAQAILHAVEQRHHLLEMGRVARSIAEQRADWEQNFQMLLKAYELAYRYG
jgi:glycosyltransferase involved in cell wall biosynthesis